MAELVDALDLGSSGETRESSSLSFRTIDIFEGSVVMQVSVENIGSLGRRLTISMPVSDVKTAVQEQMQSLSQKAVVSGFRPGKVPKQVLEQKFGQQVRKEAVGKVIENSLPLVLQQNNLKPAGRPMVEQIENDWEKEFSYVVSFEIFPEVSLGDFSKIEVDKYKVKVTPQDIDKTIEKLKEQFSEWVVVDREARAGDRLVVDYTSTMNGKPYENSIGKDILVVIGSKLYIEGFETGLIGTVQGETKSLNLQFPADWRLEKFAGKPVEFTVHVKAVTEKCLAEINENFAKRIGANSVEIETIRETIKGNLEKQLEEVKTARLKDQVAEALLKMNPIPVPKALVERETAILHEEMHRRMGNQAEQSCHHPGLEGQAEKRVTLGLILNEVIKVEKLTPDEEVVKKKVASIAKMFGNADFIESMYQESDEILTQVRHTVLLDQALDVVVSRVTQNEKTATVDELFTRQA